MRVFFAGIEAYTDTIWGVGDVDVLFSFYIIRDSIERFMEFIKKYKKKYPNRKTFCDSGGFTFLKKGHTQIPKNYVNKYADFLEKYRLWIDYAANIDVTDPKVTLRNQKYLESKGLKILPVYHPNEPIDYLERYSKGYDYIAIGGLVPLKGKKRVETTIRIINTALKFNPALKIHLFGVNDLKIIKLLSKKVYSVDATTWLSYSRYGGVISPSGRLIHRNELKIGKPHYKKMAKYSLAMWKSIFKKIGGVEFAD